MSINGFPDGPPTRSGQSISDYYAGHALRVQHRLRAALSRPHRQGPAHRHRAARQHAGRPRQPRRALHGRRRDAHARRQRLVRRLELRASIRRPTATSPSRRARATRCGGASAKSSAGPSSTTDPEFATVPARRDRRDRVAAIIQAWTSGALQGRGRQSPDGGRRAGRAGEQRRRDGRRPAGAGARDVRRDRPSRSTARSRSTGTPLKLSETPGRIRWLAPMPGEHNEEIFVDLLGHSKDELERWRADGVI